MTAPERDDNAVGPTPHPAAARRYTVAQVARRLGLSKREVRSRIRNGLFEAEHDGNRWWVTLSATDGGAAEVTLELDLEREPEPLNGSLTDALGAPPSPSPPPPATADEIARAVARANAHYVADLRVVMRQLDRIYQGQLQAKDELIRELRRRAEAAEAELAAARQRAQIEPEPSVPSAESSPDRPANGTLPALSPLLSASSALSGRLWRRVRQSRSSDQ